MAFLPFAPAHCKRKKDLGTRDKWRCYVRRKMSGLPQPTIKIRLTFSLTRFLVDPRQVFFFCGWRKVKKKKKSINERESPSMLISNQKLLSVQTWDTPLRFPGLKALLVASGVRRVCSRLRSHGFQCCRYIMTLLQSLFLFFCFSFFLFFLLPISWRLQ